MRWIGGDLLDPGLPLAPAGYDAVTALSSLHHLPLRPGLGRLAGLLRPGGVLVVVGLYRLATPPTRAGGRPAPANAAVGVVLAPRRRAGSRTSGMPAPAGRTSWPDIRAAARELVPGAQVRRHLFWRYSLLWHRPVPSQKAGELPVSLDSSCKQK